MSVVGESQLHRFVLARAMLARPATVPRPCTYVVWLGSLARTAPAAEDRTKAQQRGLHFHYAPAR